MRPRMVFGVPLYNRAEYLPRALESLLAQTYRDFAVVMVDDCSRDETSSIARSYAARDPRVVYRRNARRLGMIRNWRRCFELARELHPEMELFAWASDHDEWDPRWLEMLVAELQRHPEVVLTYPLSLRVDKSGETVRAPWTFDTFGVADAWDRFVLANRGMAAGSMVYGLFRAEALTRAGVFRSFLLPDRLLIAEMSLYGQFKQVPRILWYRRFGKMFSWERQRAAFFPDGAPRYAYLPWWLTHAGVLAWSLAVRGAGRPAVGRLRGLWCAIAYVRLGATAQLRSSDRQRRRALRRLRKLMLRVYRRVRRPVRRFARFGARLLRRDGLRVGRRVRHYSGYLWRRIKNVGERVLSRRIGV